MCSTARSAARSRFSASVRLIRGSKRSVSAAWRSGERVCVREEEDRAALQAASKVMYMEAKAVRPIV